MATRVYSPAGEPFDIPRRDLADKLILEDGWTQTAPVSESVSEIEKPTSKTKNRVRHKSKVGKVKPKIVKGESVEDQFFEDVKE